jgi:formate/nitrite transporter FocA (FNT family)
MESRDGQKDDDQDLQANGSSERQIEQREEEVVQERTAISAHVVYRAILAEGEAELERPTSALAFSGLAAGLSMGFSFLAEGFLEARLPHSHWAPLVGKLGYSMGFVIVILGRQQLFTENTLTPIIPLLKHKKMSTLRNTLRLWAAVFLANWTGTMLFAWVLQLAGIIPASDQRTFIELGQTVLSNGFGETFARAIFAGWLIALLVWLLPFAEAGRVAVIILMTYLVSLGSFRHVVAGSVDAFYMVVIGANTWGDYFVNFLIPTLLGNIVGGVALVAVLNHAQVTAGSEEGS